MLDKSSGEEYSLHVLSLADGTPSGRPRAFLKITARCSLSKEGIENASPRSTPREYGWSRQSRHVRVRQHQFFETRDGPVCFIADPILRRQQYSVGAGHGESQRPCLVRICRSVKGVIDAKPFAAARPTGGRFFIPATFPQTSTNAKKMAQ